MWQNDSTRQAVVCYLGGSQGNIPQGWDWLSSAGVDGWTIVGMSDFNGDGKPDLVWQNDATQQVVVWYLGGSQGIATWVGTGWRKTASQAALRYRGLQRGRQTRPGVAERRSTSGRVVHGRCPGQYSPMGGLVVVNRSNRLARRRHW